VQIQALPARGVDDLQEPQELLVPVPPVPARITPRRASLAADLLRHELLMTQQPVPDHVVDEIVDDIVLPLLAPSPDTTGGREPAVEQATQDLPRGSAG
jgi:hypothetical protein